jgi:hypothetical protein
LTLTDFPHKLLDLVWRLFSCIFLFGSKPWCQFRGFFNSIYNIGCNLEISLSGIVGIVGNFGSGKTEVSINLAVNRKRAGLDVRLADLDLVNPYFRTREARTQLEERGVEVILPPEQYLHADLPVLSPVIAGMIKKTDGLTLLDVGGDDVGAMVLAALADSFKDVQVHLLQVVNPMRPQTRTIEGCLKIRQEIETAAKLTITGLIGNANLINETDSDEIYSGYEFVQKLSDESGLPLEFITIAREILPGVELKRFSCPVLTIARQLVPPWLKAKDFGSAAHSA